MLYLFLELIRKIGHVGVDLDVVEMFVGIVLISPHKIITHPLETSMGLKACLT